MATNQCLVIQDIIFDARPYEFQIRTEDDDDDDDNDGLLISRVEEYY